MGFLGGNTRASLALVDKMDTLEKKWVGSVQWGCEWEGRYVQWNKGNHISEDKFSNNFHFCRWIYYYPHINTAHHNIFGKAQSHYLCNSISNVNCDLIHTCVSICAINCVISQLLMWLLLYWLICKIKLWEAVLWFHQGNKCTFLSFSCQSIYWHLHRTSGVLKDNWWVSLPSLVT